MASMTEYWEPRTEADLEAACAQGLLGETHIFDAKKQPPPSHKNPDIAVDFASFAVDGGRILYGADQPKSNGPTTLVPFDTTQLAERLDQIARSGMIDPPVRIRCVDIQSSQPGRGYLLVVVPRSPEAPHMVDGKYRGRSDRTNTILSDIEVRRIMAERRAREQDIAVLLDDEVARDPTGPELRKQWHLFIVAQPIRADRHLLGNALGTQDWRRWVQGEFRQKVQSFQPARRFAPDLFGQGGASNADPRMSGWAIHTYEMAQDRRIQPNGSHAAEEDDLLDLEIRDDGGLRLFCARATYGLRQRDDQVIFDTLIVTLARRMVRAAAAVSEKAQFLGEWSFGLALRGTSAAFVERGPIIRLDPYDETTTVSYEQLDQDPDGVARQLLTRFFRGLGYLDHIPDLVENPSA